MYSVQFEGAVGKLAGANGSRTPNKPMPYVGRGGRGPTARRSLVLPSGVELS
jgi:hypothetical protein